MQCVHVAVGLIFLLFLCVHERQGIKRLRGRKPWKCLRIRAQWRRLQHKGNAGNLGPPPHEKFAYLRNRAKTKHDEQPELEKLRSDWYDPSAPHVSIEDKMKPADKELWTKLCHKRDRSSRNGIPVRGKRQATSTPRIRKEYRKMTQGERDAFHNAVRQLKTTTVTNSVGVTIYDNIASHHNAGKALGAHYGPAFPLWHRAYLLVFEEALRDIDDTVTLPYWASDADNAIGTAYQDSAMFTADGIGNMNGAVNTGPFANFAVINNCTAAGNVVTRDLRGNNNGRNNVLYDYAELRAVEHNYQNYRSFMRDDNVQQTGWQSNWENQHGLIHLAVGGHMSQLGCSPNDPLFFMHHCYVDYLFQRLINKQNTADRFDTQYYSDGSVQNHGLDDTAVPFVETFRKIYTTDYSTIYTYEDAPSWTSCSSEKDCGGNMLWCSSTLERCVGRVRAGARPVNDTVSSCYCRTQFPVIINGRCDCQESPPEATTKGPITTTTTEEPDFNYGDWWNQQAIWDYFYYG